MTTHDFYYPETAFSLLNSYNLEIAKDDYAIIELPGLYYEKDFLGKSVLFKALFCLLRPKYTEKLLTDKN